MEIKVTKRGTLPEEIVHAVTCIYCKSEMELTISSPGVRREVPKSDRYIIIDCPVCKCQFSFDGIAKKSRTIWHGGYRNQRGVLAFGSEE